jgi:hypothetical protein
MLQRTRRDVVTLRQQAGWLVTNAARLRWLPKVGPLLGEGPALLELGDALTELGAMLWADARPSIERYQRGEPWQGLLPELLPAVGRDLQRKQALAARAQSAYADLDLAALPSSVEGYADLLGQALPYLADGLEIAGVAPTLLGFDAPRTYLVLALNEDELRPGGGFITGVGEVQVAEGDIVSMVFRDSYAVDDLSLPYPDPPEPLRFFMGLDLWGFRDSNWSPDFPTAARQAIALYRPGTRANLSGVVAVDQRGVQLLLDGLGTLTVAGVDGPVTSQTVIDYMRSAWAPEEGALDRAWWLQRKDFMGDLATAARAALFSGQADLVALGRGARAALEERHIQVFLADPVVSAVLARRGWDGSMSIPDGDVIALVEANVGYNKASASISRDLAYTIDLRSGNPRGEVELTYVNTARREQPCTPEIRYDADYALATQRCYWAYLRLLVPLGSGLVEVTPNPIPSRDILTGHAWAGDGQVSRELGLTAFSQALLLPTQSERQLRFTYSLPQWIVSRDEEGVYTYRLTIRKQAGLAELAGRVRLLLPENAVVLTNPAGCEFSGEGALTCTVQSSTDISVVVRYTILEAGK